MAPKSKKGAGGKGKGGTGGVVDGVDTSEMTREQLEQHAVRLRQEMEREREERNFFQLERDKLRTFWEITRQQLDENRAALRNKDREMEEKEEEHQEQAKIFKRKVKHLLYEHLSNIAEIKAESMVSLKITQENFNQQEQNLQGDKKRLKEKILEQEEQRQEEIRTVKMDMSEKLSEARVELGERGREMEVQYADRVQSLRDHLSLNYSIELAEVEERKNRQIAELLRNHEVAFSELKNYYNDITLNNLALISSLKEQMEEMKRREERMEKAFKEVQKENKGLAEPMRRAKEESAELTRQLTNYQKDKQSLAATKHSLTAAQRELEVVRWEREVLEQRLATMTEERDMVRGKLQVAIQEVQRKAGLRAALLERKLKALTEILEQRDAQCAEILSTAHLDPIAFAAVTTKVQELVSDKNSAIQQLKIDLTSTVIAHNNLLQLSQAKFEKHGIPKEELNIDPLPLPKSTY